MEQEAKDDCVDAFEVVHQTPNQSIIKQGSQGDFFYIIQKGKCDVYVKQADGSKFLEHFLIPLLL